MADTSAQDDACSDEAPVISQPDHVRRESVINYPGRPIAHLPSHFEAPRFEGAVLFDSDAFRVRENKNGKWRMRSKMKTLHVGLILCLNIGVDPPDVVKTIPCAKLECWLDPFKNPPQRSLENIGRQLQLQYERWQSRAKYRQALDPTVEDTNKLCVQLRRSARDERVLLHYNGHGVPRPTPNGEIWVFNKNYTQYIPLSFVEMAQWVGTPAVFVFDCPGAGILLNWINPQNGVGTAGSHTSLGASNTGTSQRVNGRDTIVLCACQAHETLPMTPDLPADLFTACLTTPIKIALRWACAQSPLIQVDPDDVDKIPGKLGERKTPMGELNWIFTAVTDTIAWNELSRDLFQLLFRQDLLMAALGRNFLLAQRIMHAANCTPQSYPPIPDTHQNSLWAMWDHAAELCLCQLAEYLRDPSYVFKPSSFFSDQLTAFEVWLNSRQPAGRVPQQLPIVLQVLLSQGHRLRALQLLARYLDMGEYAVSQALSIQIFPYILRLLQSPAPDLRQVLVFIWGKILCFDRSCQADIVKENGHAYFISFLDNDDAPTHLCATCFFVLALVCSGYKEGQVQCATQGLMQLCFKHIVSASGLVRQWVCLCLAKLTEDNPENRLHAFKMGMHNHILNLLRDNVPEVRAAAACCLSELIGPFPQNSDVTHSTKTAADFEIGRTLTLLYGDASMLVRREIAVCFGAFLSHYRHMFHSAILPHAQRGRSSAISLPSGALDHVDSNLAEEDASLNVVSDWVVQLIWKMGLRLADDPCDQVRQIASTASVDFISTSLPGAGSSSRSSTPDDFDTGRAPSLRPSASSKDLRTLQNERSGGGAHTPPSRSNLLSNVPAPMPLLPPAVPTTPTPTHLYSAPQPLRHPTTPSTLASHARAPPPLTISPSSPAVANSLGGQNDGSSPNAAFSRPHTRSSFFDWCCVALRSHPSQTASALDMQDCSAAAQQQEEDLLNGDGNEDGSEGAMPRPVQPPPRARARAYSLHCGVAPIDEDTQKQLDSLMKQQQRQQLVEAQRRKDFNVPSTVAVDENSPATAQRIWRQQRNEDIRMNAQLALANHPTKLKFDERICFENDNESRMTTCLCLHPYQPLLVAADERDRIVVWNYTNGEQVRRFCNHNAKGSLMTAMAFANTHDRPLLLVGSSEGVVRVWKDFDADPPNEATLVTAWRVVPLVEKSSTLSIDWQQQHGHLVTAGLRTNLFVWDSVSELCLRDIKVDTQGGGITSLSSDTSSKGVVVAGCVDGTIRLYDVRSPNPQCMVGTMSEHGSWVTRVAVQRGGDGVLVSAEQQGVVKVWDWRTMTSVLSFKAHRPKLMALGVHDYAPVLVSGSVNQTVKVFSVKDGSNITTIRHHYGFLGRRVAPVSCLSFHSFNLTFAAGFTDNIVSVYSAESMRGKSS